MNNEKCCGTCAYHKPMQLDEFICDCEYSDGYALETDYDECCEYWEDRDDEE